MPRARLRAAFPRLDDVVGRVLPADSSPLQLFSAFLETLADRGPVLDDVSRTAAGDAAIELARVALGAGLPSEPQRLREAIVMPVRRYIEMHLQEPGLTPPGIAAVHAISVRTLHEAFELTGESVGALARRRRLERCHADLVTPSNDTVLTDIARRSGLPWTARTSAERSDATTGRTTRAEECARAGSDCAVAQRAWQRQQQQPVSHGLRPVLVVTLGAEILSAGAT